MISKMSIFVDTALQAAWANLFSPSLTSKLPILIAALVVMISIFLQLLSLIRNLKGIVANISKFEQELEELRKVLRETESTNPEIENWLEDVEDLSYSLEDIVDECDYETEQLQRQKWPWLSALPQSLKLYYKLSNEVKAITIRIQEVNKRKEELSPLMGNIFVPIQTLEEPTDPELFGRQGEIHFINDFLLRPNEDEQRYGIMVIIGIDGIGKTVVAHRVFSDINNGSTFEVTVYCSVAKDLDRYKLFESIIKQVTGSFDVEDLCSLEAKVHTLFKNKKFLVVLHDLWTESTLQFNQFLVPFMDAAPGSKFLIFTRDAYIRNHITMAESIVDIGLLSDDSCWSLFCLHSRLETKMNASSELVIIGKEISKKCAGIPLLVAVLGGLLRGNENEEEWRSVLNDKSWVSERGQLEPTSVLRMGYNRLPLCLKRCFALCSLYCADRVVTRDQLVELWMVAGLLKCGKQEKDWRNLGDCYVNELVSRCLLVSKGFDMYRMHYLIRAMGQEVCGDRYRYCGLKAELVSWAETRHATFDPSILSNLLSTIEHEEGFPLRSLGIIRRRQASIQKEDMDTLFLKLGKLRLLWLEDCINAKLSNHLGQMRHLRYLRIDGSCLKEIPSEIGSMRRLSTLEIVNCYSLTQLPSELGSLGCLSTFRIVNCPVLTQLPPEMGSMSSLSTLYIFGCPELTQLPSEIGFMSNLSTLDIYECPKLTHLPSEFGSMSSLSTLCIGGCLGLTELPPEIGRMSSVSTLHITACHRLIELPSEIGSMSSLRKLFIKDCPRLTQLPSEIGSMSSLSTLYIERCISLTHLPSEIGNMSSLLNLTIKYCPRLTQLPSEIGSMRSLSILHIFFCIGLTQLPSEISNMSNLSALVLRFCPSLTQLPPEIGSMSCLSTLCIEHCASLTQLPSEIGSMSSLSSLEILHCKGITQLPSEIGNMPTLSSILVANCPRLTHLPSEIWNMNNLSTLIIEECIGLMRLPLEIESMGSSLSKLVIFKCPGLTQIPSKIGSMTSLLSLVIECCPSFVRATIRNWQHEQFININNIALPRVDSSTIRNREHEESLYT